jgi:hypothetical protein
MLPTKILCLKFKSEHNLMQLMTWRIQRKGAATSTEIVNSLEMS